MGRVAHDPRLSVHVAHNPQTPAAGPRGMWPTTPVERGMGATTPKRAAPPRPLLAPVQRRTTRDHWAARLGAPLRRTNFWIFPVAVFGSSLTKVTPLGALK